MDVLTTGFIGAGTVGTAMAVLLSRHGYQVTAVYSIPRSSAENLAGKIRGCRVVGSGQSVADSADLTFVTTPDAVIGNAVSQVKWGVGKSVVHCSGADSINILEPARNAGAMVGGFHPLQTFAGVEQAIENIPGSTFALEAGEPLLSALKTMAEKLGGRWVVLKAGDKVLYHTSAVFASNYLVTLVKMAADLWQTFSIPADQAVQALLPLIRGTLHNIETIGIPDCLTGPIARGDSGTVAKHIKVLQEKTPALLLAYKELAIQTIPIALGKGKIDLKQAKTLETILKN